MGESFEMRHIKTKLRQLENCFEDFSGKLLVRGQDSKDMDRQFDAVLSDMGKFSQSLESVLNQYSSSASLNSRNGMDTRYRSKNTRGDINVSPGGNQYHSPYNGSSIQSNQQEKKMNELLKNNDHIYQELRKATDKYLNQRVENSKLRDEIQILQQQLESSHNQAKRNQGSLAPSSPLNEGGQRQQIRLKSRPNRHEATSASNNTSSNQAAQQQQQRTLSSNSSHILRENEDLKRRVRDLEKECFQMTYYQQEMQRRGGGLSGLSDPQQRENQDLKNKLDQLCLQVQQFMLAMRRLQRAVNNKDKDIQDLKADFEKNKKQLDIMVKEIKEKDEQNKKLNVSSNAQNFSLASGLFANNSMVIGSSTGSLSKPRFSSNDNRSSSQQARNRAQALQQTPSESGQSQTITQNSNRQQPLPVSQRLNNQMEADQLPPKKAVIRAQQPQVNSGAVENNEQFNLSNPDFAGIQQANDQEQFNNLLEEIRVIQDESERLRRQLTDATEQLKKESDRAQQCEGVLSEYKDCLYKLETQEYSLDSETINHLKNALLHKEKDLRSSPGQPVTNTFGRQSFHTQTEIPIFTAEFAERMKREVVQLIANKEEVIDSQMRVLNEKLSEKDDDLTALKRLFVEKLRELETSFVDLGQDMIESEQAQQEASRVISQNKLKGGNLLNNKDLERSIEQVIGKLDDSQDEELDQLAALNEQLTDENRELREQVKQLQNDLLSNSETDLMRAQLQELHDENEHLEMIVEKLRGEKEADKASITQFKTLIEQIKKESGEHIKLRDKSLEQYKKQVTDYEALIENQNAKLQKAQELKLILEGEIKAQEKSLEAQENQFEQERTSWVELESEFQAKISELDALKQLREDDKEVDTNSVIDEQSELTRIDQNPKDAAIHYLKQFRSISKEFKILTSAQEKLQHKYEELKEKNDELKVEARESAEENMHMEQVIEELREENQRLLSGNQKTSQEDITNIKAQVEESFREKLAYKEGELEAVNVKLARISQANIELKSKYDRVEQNNAELSTENEVNRIKVQTLELQLEMTKENSERDSEKLIEQIQSLKEANSELTDETIAQGNQINDLEYKLFTLNQDKAQLLEAKNLAEVDKASLLDEKQVLLDQIDEIKADRDQLREQCSDYRDQQNDLQIKYDALEFNKALLVQQANALESAIQSKDLQLQNSLASQDQQTLLLSQANKDLMEQITELKSNLMNETQSKNEALSLQESLVQDIEKLKGDLYEAQDELKATQKQLEETKVENEEQIDLFEGEIEVTKQSLQQMEALNEELKEQNSELLQEKVFMKKSSSFSLSMLLSARKAILSMLEQEKQERSLERQSTIQALNDAKIQAEQTLQSTLDQHQTQLQQLKASSDSELHLQKTELSHVISRLEKEQKDLVASLTEQQDQQTQELLAQKDSENAILRDQIKALKDQIGQLESDIEEIERKNDKITQDKETIVKDQEALEQQVKYQEDNIQKLEQKVTKMVQDHQKETEDSQNAHIQEVEDLKKEHEENVENLNEKIKEAQEQVIELQNQIDDKNKEIESIIADRDSTLETLKTSLEAELQKLTEEKDQVISELQTQIQEKQDQIQALTEKNESLQEQIRELQEYEKDLDDEVNRLHEYQDQNAELQKTLAVEKEKFDGLKEFNESLKAKLAKCENAENDLKKEKEQTVRLLDQIQGLMERGETKKKEHQIAIDTLTQQIKELELQRDQANEGHSQKVLELENQIDELQKSNEQIRQANEQIINDQLEAQKSNQALQTQVNEQTSTIQNLETQIEDSQAQYQAQINQLQEDLKSLENQIIKERESHQANLSQTVEQLEGELSIERSEKADLTTKIAELESDNEKLLDRIQELQDEIRLSSDSETEQIKSLSVKMSSVQIQRDEAYELNKELQSEIAQLQKQLDEKTIEVDARGQDLEQAYKQIQDMREEFEMQLEQEKQISEDKLNEQFQECADLKITIQDLENDTAHQRKDHIKQLEILKQQLANERAGFSQNLESLEEKIQELNDEMISLRGEQGAIHQAQVLQISILEAFNDENDSQENEIIGDIGVKEAALQYCKRVKYQDKVWVLICKGPDSYVWIDQEKIPLEKIQSLTVIEEYRDKQESLLKKLDDLHREKDTLVKQQQQMMVIGTPRSQQSQSDQQISEYLLVKNLEMENASMKNELAELKLINNTLTQTVVQSKVKISEMQDFILNLAKNETAGTSSEALSGIVSQNQELKRKYQEAIEGIGRTEQENEILKQKIIELTDYSFATKHGVGFMSGGGARGVDPAGFDGASSINGDSIDEGDINIATNSENERNLQQRLNTLEDENQVLKKKLAEKASQSLNSSASQKQQQDEDFMHIKSLFMQFMRSIPTSISKREDLLRVLYSMLTIKPQEVEQINKAREAIAAQNVKDSAKKGVFGMFGGKK